MAQEPGVLARVDSTARASLPALQAMVVMRNGRMVWEKYWGGADSATAFNIKSVSKGLLSALTGIAIQQGRLTLTTPISKLLPDYYRSNASENRAFRAAVVRNDSVRATITIRHLLTQTSGYAWDEGGPILSTFLVSSDAARLVAEQILAATPGTTWNYSTGNTHLLAAALREIHHLRRVQASGLFEERAKLAPQRAARYVGTAERIFDDGIIAAADLQRALAGADVETGFTEHFAFEDQLPDQFQLGLGGMCAHALLVVGHDGLK
jgi:hypothetical protein